MARARCPAGDPNETLGSPPSAHKDRPDIDPPEPHVLPPKGLSSSYSLTNLGNIPNLSKSLSFPQSLNLTTPPGGLAGNHSLSR